MPTFKSLKDLNKYLQNKLTDGLKTDVARNSIKLMQKHVQEDVYDAYTPYSTDGVTPHYERTGKLMDSSVAQMLDDNTLEVTNIRADQESGRHIVPVIEYGKGYEWGYTRNLDEEIGARPFITKTRKELEEGKAKEFVKEALEKRLGKGTVLDW